MEKKTLIVGLGVTGLSVIRHCQRYGIACEVADSRETPPQLAQAQQDFPDLMIHCGSFDVQQFQQAKALIVSPGVSLQEPAIQAAIANGVPIIGDVELFAQVADSPVIAITGTNGKSTVTTLVGEMLNNAGLHAAVGGNLGVPVLDLLTEAPVDFYIIELSSFQLQRCQSLRPFVATILNISEDHLDQHVDFDEYLAAKQSIYQHCEYAVFNRDDKKTNPLWGAVPQSISVGTGSPAAGEYGISQQQLMYGDAILCPMTELGLSGIHNAINSLVAIAIAHVCGVPFEQLMITLRTFSGLAHRCQKVRELRGVQWYNDSKGTNVGACIAAIEGLAPVTEGKIVLIAGGIGKGADFTPLRAPLAKHVRATILLGEAAKQMAYQIKEDPDNVVMRASSMAQAVEYAQARAQSGDAVLLSPACASFDMFDNFMHRGDVFSQCVQALLEE